MHFQYNLSIITLTRPDTLPGISRVGWAGAVMLKNRREKKVVTDGRTDGPTDGPTDIPSYRVAWTRPKMVLPYLTMVLTYLMTSLM